jgi:hypothetical protein
MTRHECWTAGELVEINFGTSTLHFKMKSPLVSLSLSRRGLDTMYVRVNNAMGDEWIAEVDLLTLRER